MFNNNVIILGPNVLPGVGALQIFSAPGLVVPKTATGSMEQIKRPGKQETVLAMLDPAN